jgi:hypothetical protein
MTKDEFARWFGEEVQSRWRAWQVNRHLLSDWYLALGRYDAATLTEAVQQHHIRDDPVRPSIKRVWSLAGEIARALMRRAPKTEPRKCVTGDQFWHDVRTGGDFERRIGLMTNLIKFCPRARDKDPEAYDRLMQQRAAQAAGDPAPSQ